MNVVKCIWIKKTRLNCRINVLILLHPQPCTEAVFMELFHEFRDTLAPELVRLLASLQLSPAPPGDLDAILKKDAIYNAVGLAAFDLYDDVSTAR